MRVARRRIEIVARETIPSDWDRSGDFELRVLCCFERSSSASDWDNLGKLVSDALTGIAYDDDRQVVLGSVAKLYGQPEDCTVVWVGRIADVCTEASA